MFVDFGIDATASCTSVTSSTSTTSTWSRNARSPVAGARRSTSAACALRPPIQEIFQRGSEVLVQVIKEGIGTKGPTLSTLTSAFPGRYLVLMPGLQRLGVSRKIEDEDVRRRLRRSLRDITRQKVWGSSSAPQVSTARRTICTAT